MKIEKQKEPFWKKVRNGLIVTFVSLVVLFLVAEVTIRIIGYETLNIYKASDDPEIYSEHIPNVEGAQYGALVKINSDGMRDYEYGIEKAQQCFRIWGAGDSVMFGVGVNIEDTYMKKLEDMLNQNQPSPSFNKYETFNSGHCGYNTSQELAFCKRYGMKYKPDLILIGYVLNDPELTPPPEKGAFGFGGWARDLVKPILRHSLFACFVSNSLYGIRDRWRIKEGGGRGPASEDGVAYHTGLHKKDSIYWQKCEAALKEFAELAKQNNIKVLLIIHPILYKLDDSYPYAAVHKQVEETCHKYGLEVLDLFPYFKGRDAVSLWVVPTDGHPGKLGHQITAEATYNALIEKHLIPGSK